mgnify:CR=1 FL=1
MSVSNLLSVKSYTGIYTVEIYENEESDKKRKEILREESKCSFLVIDKKVSKLYPEIINNWDKEWVYEIEANEDNKELKACENLIEALTKVSFKKDMSIVAVGGGITQDVSSFVASVLYRGVDWIFIPTTLLAQSDSCIGSKTSINFKGVKNIIGNFYPPKKIYCFTDFLSTLSVNDVKSGIGEILHYYIVDNSSFAKRLSFDYEKIIANPPEIFPYIIESLSIKKKMVEIDEFDRGPRRVFNYGHTFGHAIEVLSDFNLTHGQSVTLGMDIANFIAFSLGLIKEERYEKLKKVLLKNIPDYKIKQSDVDPFIALLKKDKKSTRGKIVCILPVGEDDEERVKTLINKYRGL